MLPLTKASGPFIGGGKLIGIIVAKSRSGRKVFSRISFGGFGCSIHRIAAGVRPRRFDRGQQLSRRIARTKRLRTG